MIRFAAILVAITLSFQIQVFADPPQLSEEAVKTRTDEISRTLRCVVCQNQSIYESNAPLAIDMRRLVEERVRAGDTDREVREYLRGPYGDFILMRPPFQLNTLLLWLGPVFVVLSFAVWYLRRGLIPKIATSPTEISEEDRRRLAAVFRREDDA